MNKRTVSYKNKKVYIGMDVHKKTYTLSAYCQGHLIKTITTPADTEGVIKCIKNWFPSARVHSVYEAGFSGYVLHRVLCQRGIKNIVGKSGKYRDSCYRSCEDGLSGFKEAWGAIINGSFDRDICTGGKGGVTSSNYPNEETGCGSDESCIQSNKEQVILF